MARDRESDASFLNAVSEGGSVLNGISNWVGRGDWETWHWSEVVTYCVAVDAGRRRGEEGRAKGKDGSVVGSGGVGMRVDDIGRMRELEITEEDLRAIGKVRRIVRTNICNPEWRMAKEEVVRHWIEACERDSMVLPRVRNIWDDV